MQEHDCLDQAYTKRQTNLVRKLIQNDYSVS